MIAPSADVIIIVVAVIGAAIAGAGLGWQVAVFFLSGSRVKIVAQREAYCGAQPLPRKLDLDASTVSLEWHRDQGYKDVVALDVFNRGRSDAWVQEIFAEFGNVRCHLTPQDGDPPLPSRIEPGARQTWHVELEGLQRVVGVHPRRAVCNVVLGTGRILATRPFTVLRHPDAPAAFDLGPSGYYVTIRQTPERPWQHAKVTATYDASEPEPGFLIISPGESMSDAENSGGAGGERAAELE